MLTWAGVHCDCMHPVYMAKLPCSLPSPISRGSPLRSARRPSRWTSGERPLPDLPRTPQESWDLLCQPLFPRLCCPCGSLGGDAAPPWPLHSLSPLVLLYLLSSATINTCILYPMLVYLVTPRHCNHSSKRTDIFHFVHRCPSVP